MNRKPTPKIVLTWFFFLFKCKYFILLKHSLSISEAITECAQLCPTPQLSIMHYFNHKGEKYSFLEWEGVLKLNLYLHSGYDSLLRVSSHFFSFSKSWFPYLRGIKPKINLWTIAKASTIWTPTLSTHEIRYYLKFWLTL